ncbi:MAG: TerC family protein, partial [Pseudomonadota bacterium]
SEVWPFYLGFSGFVLAMLFLDLGVFHRKAHEVSVREASIWTAAWISLAALFNGGLYVYLKSTYPDNPEIAKQLSLEFLSGFVVEKTLAIDNVFVFAIVFSYFGIRRIYQHRILFFGIIGALLFRAAFISIGSHLMAYKSVVIFFGAVLIFTGIKMFLKAEETMEPERSWLMRLLKKIIPMDFADHGDKFFVTKKGILHATPLFMALVFLELTDLLFAIDSVPAIFALTKEPLIVFTSNIFAILGLRSMYFMLAGAIDQFKYIKYGLAAVLVFVGLKMVWLNEAFGGKFPITWSLGIIAVLIGSSMIPKLFQRSSR